MILVTLGTHPAPMDRVVAWVDALLGEQIIDRAVVQSASFRLRPARATPIGIVSGDELAALMASADRIVTHGGPGSILQVLALGRRPIVVPRDPAAGEHVDGHQVRFVTWLADRRDIVVVRSLDELRTEVLRPDARRDDSPVPSQAAARVRDIIVGSRPGGA